MLEAERVTGKERAAKRMRVAEKSEIKANATTNDRKLKKGQGNDEGDLNTQLQFEGEKKEGERRKKLTREKKGPSEDMLILSSPRYQFVCMRLYVCIYFAIFRLPRRELS